MVTQDGAFQEVLPEKILMARQVHTEGDSSSGILASDYLVLEISYRYPGHSILNGA